MAWLLLFPIIICITQAAEGKKLAIRGCQEKCGAVEIPYPFGLSPSCSFSSDFELKCNTRGTTTFTVYDIMEVQSIALTKGQVRMYNQISWQCYNSQTSNISLSTWYLDFVSTVYRLSSLENMFVVIGCEAFAFNLMWDWDPPYRKYKYRTGCVSTCYNNESLTNGSCSGNGCCHTSIPSGINYYNISFDENYYSIQNWAGRCSYAVIIATYSFNFSTSYISTMEFWSAHNGTVPIVLDWSIGNETCKVAQANSSNYACASNNSECINSKNGSGYFCNCSSGYRGNPF